MEHGKTTLVNLLPRFYDICDGNIFINGIDYRKYKLKDLRDKIAYVFQEPVIFDKTILENIRFGNREDLSNGKIIEVCQNIGLDDKIRQLSNGYDTVINDKTDLLSYGEKQLLSFARAILKDADLIIFIEDNKIAEMGTHEELIKKHKRYYDLCMSKK